MTSFGYWVRRRRKALDLTQAGLAQRVGCAPVTIRKIEKDERRPSQQMAERLADGLAIPNQERGPFIRKARGEYVERAPVPGSAVEMPGPTFNLPLPATVFIGRAEELAAIRRDMLNAACRLLSLIGPGGIGKTRLAIEAAHQLAAAIIQPAPFPDGIFFVSLIAIDTPAGLISALATAVGFAFYSNIVARQQLLDYLREKKLLLVLDNFEHLLASSRLLTEILSVAPGVKLLVTSRETVPLQEAWFHPVRAMTYPPQGLTKADDLETYDAVHLFVQNARRFQPGFSLDQNRASVSRICHFVGGAPLALELAAAWLKVLPCDHIVRELSRNLDLLATPLKNVPERHRSMRVVFEQTWQRLPEEIQMILKKLSVFRGGFQLAAAEQIGGASLFKLMTLVDQSLLWVDGAGRYHMHELLRQFTTEKLVTNSEEAEATQTAHAAFYLDFLATHQIKLMGKDQRVTLSIIQAELENIRTAWKWAIQMDEIGRLERTLAGLYHFYLLRYRYSEGAERFAERGDTGQQTEGGDQQPATTPFGNGLVTRRAADHYYRYYLNNQQSGSILALAQTHNDRRECSFALRILGEIAGWQGDQSQADVYRQASLTLSKRAGDLMHAARQNYILTPATSTKLESVSILVMNSVKRLSELIWQLMV